MNDTAGPVTQILDLLDQISCDLGLLRQWLGCMPQGRPLGPGYAGNGAVPLAALCGLAEDVPVLQLYAMWPTPAFVGPGEGAVPSEGRNLRAVASVTTLSPSAAPLISSIRRFAPTRPSSRAGRETLASVLGIAISPVQNFQDFGEFGRYYEGLFAVLSDPGNLARLFLELAEDAADEGVVYVEVAVCPQFYVSTCGCLSGCGSIAGSIPPGAVTTRAMYTSTPAVVRTTACRRRA
ncbi:hypothetical protein [Streptomyces sp. NPDC001508]|uniref:hypothetical protein n=1 Tax=Streptomyces sp. NPDC001508 TaxID=3154656 RepID=UPI003322CAD6